MVISKQKLSEEVSPGSQGKRVRVSVCKKKCFVPVFSNVRSFGAEASKQLPVAGSERLRRKSSTYVRARSMNGGQCALASIREACVRLVTHGLSAPGVFGATERRSKHLYEGVIATRFSCYRGQTYRGLTSKKFKRFESSIGGPVTTTGPQRDTVAPL